VYSVADPEAPVLLGRYHGEAAEAFGEVWLGPKVFTCSGHRLTVRRAEPLPDPQP
jgi:hypothetical protein